MSKDKYDILILFGGVSSEHEISRISAASVISRLNKEKYNIQKIGITQGGEWLLTEAAFEDIKSGKWEDDKRNQRAMISPDRSVHGINIITPEGTVRQKYIDAVFPVLHGKNGEDGTVQGLLEMAGIPYVGPGVCASACSMDKAVTKLIVKHTSVKQADCYITDRYTFSEGPMEEVEKIQAYFSNRYPFFVKPANAGSSVGVSKAEDKETLFEAIRIALEEDHKVLIEETIIGREIEVAVLGNRNARTSVIGEILAANDFYDYEAKYHNNNTKTCIVTDLSDEKTKEIQNCAVEVYKALGCKGLSRVDFFLKADGTVVFNEINTLPGFTSISMYPQLWEATGISYEELLEQLILLALDEIE